MLEEHLKLLYPGKRPEEVLEAYHRKKLSEFLTGAVLVLVLLLSGVLWNIWQRQESRVRWAERPEYHAGERQGLWEVEREDGTVQDVGLSISERFYTEEEAQERLKEAVGFLEKEILGENKSSDRVEYPLVFPEEIGPDKIMVQWFSERPEILSSRGDIASDYLEEKGTLVPVRAVLSFQSQEMSYDRTFRVYPVKREADELFFTKVEAALREAEQGSREKEGFALPKEIDGESIVFRKKGGKELFLLAGLCLIIVLLLYISRDEKINREVSVRKEQLLNDYPDLVSKLTVLLRAGLTVKASFGKITADYRRRKEREGIYRYVYEELTITYYEMANGVPEGKAYEQFGRRCGLIPYMRLGGLLAQNIRKGNKRLLMFLNQEAQEAFEERKRRAKKAGEEAGTRMLVPMVLMLLVTILIILYPAFSSFYI